MPFAPDVTETLARSRADLRMGVPIVLGTMLVFAAETLTPQRLADALSLEGDPVLAITARRAETLKARAYDGDLARLRLPQDASLSWIQSIADPADDLRAPLKGPLIAEREGDASTHRTALNVVKSARLLPAAVILELANPAEFAATHSLTHVDSAAAAVLLQANSPLHSTVHARLPIEVSEKGRLHIFRPENGGEEHYAIEIGRPDRQAPVLCRLHSACFTGDVMGSMKCDCGPQLHAALAQMGKEGHGVLLYLNQEGRGIGLANKMRAYSLQDQGFDTVEANHRLGFEDDERDFRLGADILKKMGFSAVNLLTNNPRKVDMMEQSGVHVAQRVPLVVGENRFNTDYLATKAAKSGHFL
ncbi:GTP cyclohydrolase II [Sulfitobacter donghicola]|uniref:GTP cyclohydrolase-2 n=1 Tax=Sulfitobacter donghicola DSW-25 = KCTC 12864 = JCM 14565 TaxID=1300350 RepID=A0A073ILQ2_9RHOB|nr:GTP cyclohydrolase II [Sulfitobacter donghicola]KEJ90426.1 GTP cyclohydrolase [Sulfitobacter donghicola DSW-25 = KCTC 12864 = JCM 14565]KIN67656.1 GTP cyclohydrolase-2 [Sulfitobacter donghicola DSW-25 = KCTC 12864 = JCM 14565]